MKIERVYLGTWSQRTNLHLQEVYRFLKYAKGVDNLDETRVKALREAVRPSDVQFRNASINSLRAACGPFTVSVTEDGVVLMSSEETDLARAREALVQFHEKAYEPAMHYLFSRGAPMPKEIAAIEKDGDFLTVVRDAGDADVREVFEAFGDRYHSHASTEGIRVFTGHRIEIVDIGRMELTEEETEGFVRDLVFFKEFERQMYAYVRLHRVIWDELSSIRDARSLRYADFPSVRADIMRFEMTLGVVRARIAQMDDILGERRSGEPKGVTQILASLGMLDFGSLHASRRYVSHLWDMTDDYADDTLSLLETLYQENTQRELNALKFITLITAVTSFFGMNIAFPWEERWATNAGSSYQVVIIVTAIAFAVFYLLRALILNRRFELRGGKRAETVKVDVPTTKD
ncbi:MAG TPA: hypothetical protein VL426_06440 [Candidatus Binatia bacterium]|jgi:hypothetical protein|nr:hypothetical protein [Candidatus Binatia bacterium]